MIYVRQLNLPIEFRCEEAEHTCKEDQMSSTFAGSCCIGCESAGQPVKHPLPHTTVTWYRTRRLSKIESSAEQS